MNAPRLAWLAAAAGLWVCAAASGQSSTPAVFVAHYFPVNSVSPIGATIAAFRIAPDGAATLVGNYPSGEWTQAVAISPDGRYLASANGTGSITEEVRIFRINADASLTQVHQATTLNSPLDMTWASNSILAITRTQSGGSFIRTYRWNEQTPSLIVADQEPTGYFNSAVVRHPTQPWIYTQDSGIFGGLRIIQQWGVAENGILTNLGFTPSIDPPLKPTISPNGRWLFTGTGAFGGNTVGVFSLDPETGAPTEIVGSPFSSPGDTPYRTAVSRDHRYLFVGHTVDDTVRTFTLDNDTGQIVPTDFSFDAGPRGSLGPIGVVGDKLVVIKDSNDPIGMWVFGIGETGELSQIGPLHNTGNRRPEMAIATWVPPASTCAADINNDGQVGVQDIFDYLALYFANDPAADFDNSGAVALADLFAFLASWFTGCP
jgi:hypothetical protein